MAKKIDVDIEAEAIQIVKNEITAYEDAVCFVTDKVAFNMRNLIKTLRKNYWGIFDTPNDKLTGREKIWIPLTESVVEAVVKNIDLDTKDINFRAKHPDAVGLTAIVRNIVRNRLDEIYFGEYLDEEERQKSIDGTAVWKTIKEDGEMILKNVDLLNVYIDPTARSIQDAYRFTERAVLSVDELKAMDGWINTEDVVGTSDIHPTDNNLTATTFTSQNKTKVVDIYELWGKIPKYLITGSKKDKDEIDGHLVVSGLEGSQTPRVHLIEKNKEKTAEGKALKPYEEDWYTRVPGRWYGKGVAEKVMMLQLWLNTIVNIRINRSYVSQLGIFKIKKGAGVTPQMVSRLASNGAIMVNSMDDIEQFVMQEASQASYTDEGNIQNWAEKVTSAFSVVTGEQLPSTTPATNAVIQNQNAKSQFVMIKEATGMFLQRWLKRHAMPILLKNLSKEELIRVTGDGEEMRDIVEKLVNYAAAKKLEEIKKEGKFVDPQKVISEIERVIDKFETKGVDLFIKMLDTIDVTKYDVEVYITNEEIDKGVLAQNLITTLQIAPEYRDIVMRQIFDLMGLPVYSLKKKQPMMPQGQMPGGQQQVQTNPQEQVLNANSQV